MNGRTALIAGSTGLVGHLCLAHLLKSDYSRVISVSRRPTELSHPKLEERLVDFNHLSAADVAGANDIYCALGTTIAKAGSQDAFRQVDRDYVVSLARRGVETGATQFILVSSVGANHSSSNFYLKTKGETEQEITSLPFSGIHIFRPGLLVGRRDEARPGEKFAQIVLPPISFLLAGPLRKYRPISAAIVATAMVSAATRGSAGVHLYYYDEMKLLGREGTAV